MENKNEIKNYENILLECERRHIFLLMMCIGGFFGGYTYCARGGVFCNAQTANIVLFGIYLSQGNLKMTLYYIIPMLSYFAGTIISELMPKFVRKHGHIRWDTAFVGFEIILVLILGFIPESAPVQICHILVNFMCSMQYNTFRRAENIPMATTFCTAHVRQAGVYLTKWMKHHESKKYLRNGLLHLSMIGVFIAGVVLASICSTYLGTKAIWVAEILLVITFADLLHADLTKEKGLLGIAPKGH